MDAMSNLPSSATPGLSTRYLRDFGASKGINGHEETSKLFGYAADEIDRLRKELELCRAVTTLCCKKDQLAARSETAPKLDKDGFPVVDLATWDAAIERCAKQCEIMVEVAPEYRAREGYQFAAALRALKNAALQGDGFPAQQVRGPAKIAASPAVAAPINPALNPAAAWPFPKGRKP